MKTAQSLYQNEVWSSKQISPQFNSTNAQLVLVFGSGSVVTSSLVFEHIKELYPNASIVLSSTSGEILDNQVYDDTAVVTAIEFEKTQLRCVELKVNKEVNSRETGIALMKQLAEENLSAVLVISEGSFINGSELVGGLNELNLNGIPVTGGLAGDAARFSSTQVGLNAPAAEGNVVAIGFYGKSIQIGHSSFGGWDEFGKERIVTKSDKNVLYEVDGKNALDLYKEYLGPYVDELPGSALLFPLSLRSDDSGTNLVRTILSIDEENKSMTFAGNLPEGSKFRLMKANFEKIIEGAAIAATSSMETNNKAVPDLALLISCVGRKLILQERTYEEVEAAKKMFGDRTTITGYYSYGELSPFNPHSNCELHNQTMTITTFTEA
jgi:hypothetical protein